MSGEEVHNAEMEDCDYILENLLDIQKEYGLGCEVLWSMAQSLGVSPERLRAAFCYGCAEWDC